MLRVIGWLLRRAVLVAIIAAIGIALTRLLRDDDRLAPGDAPAEPWVPLSERQPTAADPAPTSGAVSDAVGDESPETPPWVDPVDGVCPTTHPVKGKRSSKIFHVVGGISYDRTVPDRCYRDAAAAEADGLRQSKR